MTQNTDSQGTEEIVRPSPPSGLRFCRFQLLTKPQAKSGLQPIQLKRCACAWVATLRGIKTVQTLSRKAVTIDQSNIQVLLPKIQSTCMALPRTEFFIEPPPDTQRKRRRGEREIGVTRGSYLLLTGLSPPSPPSSPTPHAYCIAWGCVIRTYPPPLS